ncbi:TetR/AcrR family transcriptional regulator [Chachezhania antarctica]|uniref:TetR/AcrR family transcriptional regulator n=1 Tax=Chachezhania antarctica TaxID=2340860 RepID=UPI000EAEBCFE|nr:TetR family transcriptional regulator [Chachezhania antarctica]|tara:strand:- start:790 stop:1455 length:666 start_codon:yes stop_codon:yes gene_type:complete
MSKDPEPQAVQLGPKQRRREISDRRMLRAATSLIGRKGTAGANLAQIGIDAGYSRGLPVQRFGTKLNLLEAVIDAIQDRFMRHVAKRVGSKTGCEAMVERIRFQLEAVRDMPESAVALYQLIVDSSGAIPELKPRITELHKAYRDNLREYMLQAEAMGQLRPDIDIEQSVRAISGTISGMSIQAIVDETTDRLGDDATFIADLFVTRVARPEHAPGTGQHE